MSEMIYISLNGSSIKWMIEKQARSWTILSEVNDSDLIHDISGMHHKNNNKKYMAINTTKYGTQEAPLPLYYNVLSNEKYFRLGI